MTVLVRYIVSMQNRTEEAEEDVTFLGKFLCPHEARDTHFEVSPDSRSRLR